MSKTPNSNYSPFEEQLIETNYKKCDKAISLKEAELWEFKTELTEKVNKKLKETAIIKAKVLACNEKQLYSYFLFKLDFKHNTFWKYFSPSARYWDLETPSLDSLFFIYKIVGRNERGKEMIDRLKKIKSALQRKELENFVNKDKECAEALSEFGSTFSIWIVEDQFAENVVSGIKVFLRWCL